MGTFSVPPAQRGAVVLVPFPFTDLSTNKTRPAVVLSVDVYQRVSADVIIAQVTGNMDRSLIGDHVLLDWKGAGLLKPSVVRSKLATVHSSMIVRTLGYVSHYDLTGIEGAIRTTLGLGS